MPAVDFSLTERAIINPVLWMRADLLNDPESPPGIIRKVGHFIEAALIARVIAVFTSVFAFIDASVHLLTGICKGGYLLLRKYHFVKPASWNKAEVYGHFQNAALFAGATLVGSVAGVIWPGVVKYFQSLNPTDSGEDLKDCPESISELVSILVEDSKKDKLTPLGVALLKLFWESGDLSYKHWFVKAFNQNGQPFQEAREKLASIVYSSFIAPLDQVQWLNQPEVWSRLTVRKTQTFSKGFFFHATSVEALKSILKTRRVEVRHEKAYRGAWVSTQPEPIFGKCILVFKRNIERLSKLNLGFMNTDSQGLGQAAQGQAYWAGFARDIPVTETTLAYIILDSEDKNERRALKESCKEWAGRKIQVIRLKNVVEKLQKIKDLNLGIPKEWIKGPSNNNGPLIFRAMQIAAGVYQPAVAVPQPVVATTQPTEKVRSQKRVMAFA